MASLAQRIHDKGWDQGIQQGMQQGMQQGELKGKLEGEHNKAIDMARKLFSRGLAAKDIADISGLPLHEVELLTVE